MFGEAAAERSLARRRLAQTGRHDVAHDALVHRVGFDAGAADRLAYGHGAELGRREPFQGAQELAGGSTNGGNDDGVLHLVILTFAVSARGVSANHASAAGDFDGADDVAQKGGQARPDEPGGPFDFALP